jgi:hypothetical protein
MLRRRWPVLLFALWTGYVWVTRIVNAWTASTEAMTAKVISTIVSVVLVAGAVALLATLVRARARVLDAVEVRLLQVMSIATLVVWAVRVPQILLDADHDVPFKVVHVTLAVISLVLAGLTWRVAAREAALGEGDSSSSDPRRVSPAVSASR